jgi:predicted CopG family antitoxin
LKKTITVRDEVYRKLLTVKRREESFSKLLEKLIEDLSTRELLKRLRASVEFTDKERALSEIQTLRPERRK